ncbi:hypothetical protein UU5_07628 [Rhodanobacter sp. 115]|nr:hypothetical protein UU5_07628 [Rhodanobacter sp. 115]
MWPIRGTPAATPDGYRMLDIALYLLAAALIIGGLVGTVLPALPGLPMIFGGIWLAAAVDNYQHLGLWWLLLLGGLAALGVAVDFVSASLGAKRVGASKAAIWGATLGTLVGMFFGLPGLILGPFVGALLGEFGSSGSVLRSAHVGIGTWLGLLFGALLKLVLSLLILALAAFGWWLA